MNAQGPHRPPEEVAERRGDGLAYHMMQLAPMLTTGVLLGMLATVWIMCRSDAREAGLFERTVSKIFLIYSIFI
jgi:hypothetical protein